MQFRVCQTTYLFRFKTGFFFLSLFFFVIFCLLGYWQLQRYHYKKNLQTIFAQRNHAKPIPFTQLSLSIKDLQFQPVLVTGEYQDQLTLLIQNQVQQGQMGFEVLTPIKIPNQSKLLLIDRGWIAKNNLINLPHGSRNLQTISGRIKLLDDHHFILGKNIYEPNKQPLVVQTIDLSEISKINHQKFFHFIVRLNNQDQKGLQYDEGITAITPERHLGYSIQWFVMAAVLIIAFFCFCCEKVKNELQ